MKKIIDVLFLTFITLSVMTSCSSDSDEPNLPLEGIEINSATPLDENGDMTVILTANPKEAKITSAEVPSNPLLIPDWIKVTKLEVQSDGKYRMALRVTDFSEVKSTNTVEVKFSQADGMYTHATVKVDDPYSIQDKYTLASPRTFSYHSADKDDVLGTGLPVIVVAEKQDDLAQIDINNIILLNGATTQKLGADYFDIVPMEGVSGFTLKMKADKLADAQKSVTTFESLNFRVLLPGKYKRFANLHLHAAAFAPQAIVENEALTMLKSDLSNPYFSNEFGFDVTNDFKHMGIIMGEHEFKGRYHGFYNENGVMVEDEDSRPFIIYDFIRDTTEGNIKCYLTLEGYTEFNCAPGTYYDVWRYQQLWEYDGKTYNPICADLKFKIVII